MINWQYFPKSDRIPGHLGDVIIVFEKEGERIKSEEYHFSSDEVLKVLRQGLESIGYDVEKSKKLVDKIQVPVLFGEKWKT